MILRSSVHIHSDRCLVIEREAKLIWFRQRVKPRLQLSMNLQVASVP